MPGLSLRMEVGRVVRVDSCVANIQLGATLEAAGIRLAEDVQLEVVGGLAVDTGAAAIGSHLLSIAQSRVEMVVEVEVGDRNAPLVQSSRWAEADRGLVLDNRVVAVVAVVGHEGCCSDLGFLADSDCLSDSLEGCHPDYFDLMERMVETAEAIDRTRQLHHRYCPRSSWLAILGGTAEGEVEAASVLCFREAGQLGALALLAEVVAVCQRDCKSAAAAVVQAALPCRSWGRRTARRGHETGGSSGRRDMSVTNE